VACDSGVLVERVVRKPAAWCFVKRIKCGSGRPEQANAQFRRWCMQRSRTARCCSGLRLRTLKAESCRLGFIFASESLSGCHSDVIFHFAGLDFSSEADFGGGSVAGGVSGATATSDEISAITGAGASKLFGRFSFQLELLNEFVTTLSHRTIKFAQHIQGTVARSGPAR